jgi:hypothetical protein
LARAFWKALSKGKRELTESDPRMPGSCLSYTDAEGMRETCTVIKREISVHTKVGGPQAGGRRVHVVIELRQLRRLAGHRDLETSCEMRPRKLELEMFICSSHIHLIIGRGQRNSRTVPEVLLLDKRRLFLRILDGGAEETLLDALFVRVRQRVQFL